jgi:hypothetical protein
MPFYKADNSPSPRLLIAILAISVLVVAAGVLRGYSFIPAGGADGFLYQVDYVRASLAAGDWSFLDDPLHLVHLLRYAVVWPFLEAERMAGPVGSLTMLLLFLIPLIVSFRPQYGDWRDGAFMAARFLVLLLPLLVSGRTMVVAAGMGYLVSGIMARPFSSWRMLLGCLAAVLSSASILFSIAVLLLAGNWSGRSRNYYAAKATFLVLLVGLFLPSLLAKAEGFSNGAAGYSVEVTNSEDQVQSDPTTSIQADEYGTGPIVAVQRIVLRSTVVQSASEGNYARLVLYCGLFLAAWAFVLSSIASKRWHPMRVVLFVLSGGILLEGLALWSILLPLVWAYTGVVPTSDAQAASEDEPLDLVGSEPRGSSVES